MKERTQRFLNRNSFKGKRALTKGFLLVGCQPKIKRFSRPKTMYFHESPRWFKKVVLFLQRQMA
jgi:hypothetical protein